MTRPRARIWLLSVAAVLLPAAGIGYLGAQAYGDERGAVAQQIDESRHAAQDAAAWLEGEIGRALDAVEAGTASAATHPLARFAFRIDDTGALVDPDPSPLGSRDGFSPAIAPSACSDRGLDECINETETEHRRARQLVRARVAELAPCSAPAACAQIRGKARDEYLALSEYDDTGPEALLGLARLARAAGDVAAARAHLQNLASRFDHRDVDGMPIALAAALGAAELDGVDAMLATYGDVLGKVLRGPPAMVEAAVVRIGRVLDGAALSEAQRATRHDLDARLVALQSRARMAAGLLPDVDAVVSAAGVEPRSRPAERDAERTLVFRHADGGGVVGIAVDGAMLEAAIPPARLAAIAPTARPRVLPVGRSPEQTLRTLSEVPIAALPHLTLAAVNSQSDPDPLDDVIASRSRRHVVLTSALAMILMIGLLATIRGAARERELARLKSDFVSTVSHELKTPLTSIRMFAEMLQQGVAAGDVERTARYHGVIVKESQRLGLLIANLLDYAQIERGTRRYTPRREVVADIARAAVDTFGTLTAAEPDAAVPAAIEIDVAPDAADAVVMVDRDVIVQALLNLLANAVKYGGGTPITMSVAAADGRAAIAITDRGPGIPAIEHDRIFREFYRAPAAYTSGVEGTGLGLALVKRHVEAQGGDVAVSSTPGRTTFTIRLPLMMPESEDVA